MQNPFQNSKIPHFNKNFKFIIKHLGGLSEFEKSLRDGTLEVLNEWLKDRNEDEQKSLITQQ